MTAGHVLSAHKGHRARITDEHTLRCVECDMTLLLPRVVSTSTPPPLPWLKGGVKGYPPTAVPEWEQARKRWPRRGAKP